MSAAVCCGAGWVVAWQMHGSGGPWCCLGDAGGRGQCCDYDLEFLRDNNDCGLLAGCWRLICHSEAGMEQCAHPSQLLIRFVLLWVFVMKLKKL